MKIIFLISSLLLISYGAMSQSIGEVTEKNKVGDLYIYKIVDVQANLELVSSSSNMNYEIGSSVVIIYDNFGNAPEERTSGFIIGNATNSSSSQEILNSGINSGHGGPKVIVVRTGDT